MSTLKIIPFGDPVLRQIAKPVTVFHKKLYALLNSMASTIERRDDGAALAATQVGVLKRITVVDYEKEYIELINPEILAAEGEQTDYEGCLSFSGYFGFVSRFNYVKVKYLNRTGQENIMARKGRLACCIQHEIDHLNGVLFIDRMKEDYLIHAETNTKISLQSVLDLSNGKIQNMHKDLLF